MYKIYNKTFQPLQIMVNQETIILPKRARNSFVKVRSLTEQIKTLEKKDLIKVKKES